MNYQTEREHGRLNDQLRTIHITSDVLCYPASSVLFDIGQTKVLCAVTLQQGVPSFLRGKKTGWLNAEYALLPAATSTRTPREISIMKRSGRSVEISRLISRTLRTIVNLAAIGECTITIDCDVLQADGGTRVACITASYFALALAQERWLQTGVLANKFLTDSLVAISVGSLGNQVLLDPDYREDSMLQADFNFVVTGSGKLVEVQGGAEQAPIEWHIFDAVRQMAIKGTNELFVRVQDELSKQNVALATHGANASSSPAQSPLFSLKNRLSSY